MKDPGERARQGAKGGGRETQREIVFERVFEIQFGLAVSRWAGKWKDLSSIPLQLSFLFRKVVVCGHCLVTLSINSY